MQNGLKNGTNARIDHGWILETIEIIILIVMKILHRFVLFVFSVNEDIMSYYKGRFSDETLGNRDKFFSFCFSFERINKKFKQAVGGHC